MKAVTFQATLEKLGVQSSLSRPRVSNDNPYSEALFKTMKYRPKYPFNINSLHSNLKRWMSRFNGVATKYLSNYLKWHKWINIFISEKETIRTKNLIVHSDIPYNYTMIKDFKTRQPIFI